MNDTDLQGAKILLVDDKPANLDMLCDLLEARGYDILMAPSGPIALKIALKARPDLILLDVMMPEMDGFETCRQLKGVEATRDIPVIYITARDLESDVVTGFKSGGVDYITKPITGFNRKWWRRYLPQPFALCVVKPGSICCTLCDSNHDQCSYELEESSSVCREAGGKTDDATGGWKCFESGPVAGN